MTEGGDGDRFAGHSRGEPILIHPPIYSPLAVDRGKGPLQRRHQLVVPDSLRDSAAAEALQEIVDLDLDALAAIVPPRGYGRD